MGQMTTQNRYEKLFLLKSLFCLAEHIPTIIFFLSIETKAFFFLPFEQLGAVNLFLVTIHKLSTLFAGKRRWTLERLKKGQRDTALGCNVTF